MTGTLVLITLMSGLIFNVHVLLSWTSQYEDSASQFTQQSSTINKTTRVKARHVAHQLSCWCFKMNLVTFMEKLSCSQTKQSKERKMLLSLVFNKGLKSYMAGNFRHCDFLTRVMPWNQYLDLLQNKPLHLLHPAL